MEQMLQTARMRARQSLARGIATSNSQILAAASTDSLAAPGHHAKAGGAKAAAHRRATVFVAPDADSGKMAEIDAGANSEFGSKARRRRSFYEYKKQRDSTVASRTEDPVRPGTVKRELRTILCAKS